MDGEVMK